MTSPWCNKRSKKNKSEKSKRKLTYLWVKTCTMEMVTQLEEVPRRSRNNSNRDQNLPHNKSNRMPSSNLISSPPRHKHLPTLTSILEVTLSRRRLLNHSSSGITQTTKGHKSASNNLRQAIPNRQTLNFWTLMILVTQIKSNQLEAWSINLALLTSEVIHLSRSKGKHLPKIITNLLLISSHLIWESRMNNSRNRHRRMITFRTSLSFEIRKKHRYLN